MRQSPEYLDAPLGPREYAIANLLKGIRYGQTRYRLAGWGDLVERFERKYGIR